MIGLSVFLAAMCQRVRRVIKGASTGNLKNASAYLNEKMHCYILAVEMHHAKKYSRKNITTQLSNLTALDRLVQTQMDIADFLSRKVNLLFAVKLLPSKMVIRRVNDLWVRIFQKSDRE